MDATDSEERDTTVEEQPEVEPTSHLDDFLTEMEGKKPENKVAEIMESLLEVGDCQLPIREVWEAANDAGLSTSELLSWAESAENCYVDYVNGLIRCSSDMAGDEEESDDDSQ